MIRTRVTGTFKQLDTTTLRSEERTLLDLCFPGFAREASRMASLRKLGLRLELTAAGARFADHGRLRRYAGSPDMPSGRYYTVCNKPGGYDGGTLLAELMSYWTSQTGLYVDVADTTLFPEDAARRDLPPSLVVHHQPVLGQKRPFRRHAKLGREDRTILPLTVKDLDIPDVVDLRLPQTQEWFVREFVELEMKIAARGREFAGDPGGLKLVKLGRPASFIGLLPTLVTPQPGGFVFHQAIGAWLRHHGAAGLIFPSARRDVYWKILDNRHIEFDGWNFVDYRGCRPVHWQSLFGYLPRWDRQTHASIRIEKEGDGRRGWQIRGAEDRTLRWVLHLREQMLGQ